MVVAIRFELGKRRLREICIYCSTDLLKDHPLASKVRTACVLIINDNALAAAAREY